MSLVKFARFVADSEGNVVEGVEVVVHKAGNGLADIYSDALGANKITGSLLTSSDGYFEFYCAPGEYDIYTTKSGFTFRTLYDLTIGSQGVVATPPVDTLRTARIMWNVNRCRADSSGPVVPTSVDMDRIVGTYKCNVVEYSTYMSSYDPTTDDTINAFLDAVKNWNVKTILDFSAFGANYSAIQDFISRWENDTRILGFAFDNAVQTMLTQDVINALHTNKPIIGNLGYIDTTLDFSHVDAPLFFTWLQFDTASMYSSQATGLKGYSDVVDPPGPGVLEYSTAFTGHSNNLTTIPFIPSVTVACEKLNNVFDMRYSPSGVENARVFTTLGSNADSGMIIDSWEANDTVYLEKRGLYPMDDSDPKLAELRAFVTNTSYGMGMIGGDRSTKTSYETLTNTWADNLLLNPKLFTVPNNPHRPSLWNFTVYPSNAAAPDITHDILVNNAVTTIVSSASTSAEYKFQVDIPKWMQIQFDGQPVVARLVGSATRSSSSGGGYIKLHGRNENGTDVMTCWPQDVPLNSIGTSVVSIPVTQAYSTIELVLGIKEGTTLKINDLWLGLGLPSKGLGSIGRAQSVMTGSITKDIILPGGVHTNMYLGQVPAYLHAGSTEVYVGATSTVTAVINFDASIYSQIGGLQTQSDMFQGSIAAIPTVALASGGVDVSDISYCLADMAPDGSTVSVKIHNAASQGVTLIVSAIAVSVPMKYGNLL